MQLIKELRQKKGMSLRSLAKEIGKSSAFLSELERGTRNASQETLADIAGVLGAREEIFLLSGKIEPEIEKILSEKMVRRLLRKIAILSTKDRRNFLKKIEKEL